MNRYSLESLTLLGALAWILVMSLPALADETQKVDSDKFASDVYRQRCESCHGAQLEGGKGIPSLRDGDLAWGGSHNSLVRTIRFGIRVPGNSQSHSGVMPAFKTNAAEFSDAEVDELVEYLMDLRGESNDAAAALRGKENFTWCVACHGADARGIPAVGGTNLLRKKLQYGATRKDFFQSVANGRAGTCPSWEGKLDEKSIQALAKYIETKQH